MKKVVLGIALIAVLLAGLFLPGCIRRDLSEKSGPITEQSYDYTGFTGVEIGSAMKLDVSYGTSFNVTIKAGKNLFDNIKVTQSGDLLKIYIEGWNISWWWGRTTPRVTITMPELKKLYVSGATESNVTGFSSNNDLDLKASGASQVDIDMKAGYFTAAVSGASEVEGRLIAAGSNITISGASTVDLTGSGGDIKLDVSSASTASLRYFTVNDADVRFSGASHGSMDVSGRLDVNLSGASSLNYYGNPVMGNTSVTGASDLNHRN